MVNIQLEIQTTRDIARQLLRHSSNVFQEFSQRYADPTGDLGFVLREARLQDSKNRQNSIEVQNELLKHYWEQQQLEVIECAKNAYNWAIKNGIAKEQARAVLPEGNTLSRLYMNCNLSSLIHYCDVRRSNGTQAEHINLADNILLEVSKHYPFLLEF